MYSHSFHFKYIHESILCTRRQKGVRLCASIRIRAPLMSLGYDDCGQHRLVEVSTCLSVWPWRKPRWGWWFLKCLETGVEKKKRIKSPSLHPHPTFVCLKRKVLPCYYFICFMFGTSRWDFSARSLLKEVFWCLQRCRFQPKRITLVFPPPAFLFEHAGTWEGETSGQALTSWGFCQQAVVFGWGPPQSWLLQLLDRVWLPPARMPLKCFLFCFFRLLVWSRKVSKTLP